jgi:hypothetical protein
VVEVVVKVNLEINQAYQEDLEVEEDEELQEQELLNLLNQEIQELMVLEILEVLVDLILQEEEEDLVVVEVPEQGFLALAELILVVQADLILLLMALHQFIMLVEVVEEITEIHSQLLCLLQA